MDSHRDHPTPLTELADLDAHRLWTALDRFDFDDWVDDADQPRFGFAARLARDNGWSPTFANAIVDEYRRFVFLSQVLDHPVTPSDEVDQAWHLHLTYTRSYWDDLCGQVLGRPLHHGPTRGGEAEDAKYDDWYARTLEGYRNWFGSEPPGEIWPEADTRFGEAPYWVRVNTKRQLVINRPSLSDVGSGRSRTGLLAAGSVLLAGCTGAGTVGLLAQEESDLGIGILVIAVVIIGVIWTVAKRLGGGGRSGGIGDRWGGGCAGKGGGDGGSGGCGSGGCGGACGGG